MGMVDSQSRFNSNRASMDGTGDEEEEESEAKLKEAIEILEGATFATTSNWQDF